MMAFLLKGCVLHNPTGGTTQRGCAVARLPGEGEGLAEKRGELFTSCWQEAEQKINAIISEQHNAVFSDIVNFISSAHKKLQSLYDTARKNKKHPLMLGIPTAVLLAGVNMPSHTVLFEKLKKAVHMRKISPHVVQLSPSDCSSGMRATMKKICLELDNDQASDEDGDESTAVQPHSRKMPPVCFMHTLTSWYAQSHKTRDTEKTQPQEGSCSDRPPVVIIIQDFEAFSSSVLQELILSLSNHQLEFPVVLVLCVATSVSTVNRVLPHSTVSLLAISRFHAQDPSLTLAHIIHAVLLNTTSSFKLGPKALKFLLEHFFKDTFSLDDFVRSLKFAMLEHFCWQPLSVLCQSNVSTFLSGALSSPPHTVCAASQGNTSRTATRDRTKGRAKSKGRSKGKSALTAKTHLSESIRATPSMQRYIESLPPARRLALLRDDAELIAEVKVLLSSLEKYHLVFYPLLKCLHYLTRSLPHAPLSSKLHELYLMSLEESIVEQNKFKTAWGLINALGQCSLEEISSHCIQELQRAIAASAANTSAVTVLRETLSIFKDFLKELEKPIAQAKDTEVPESLSLSKDIVGNKKLMLQERLRQLASRHSEPSKFERARSTLADILLLIFAEHLAAPKHLPLHEALYFDQLGSLQDHLTPSLRLSLHRALTTPSYYLRGDSAAGLNKPDVCLLYSLHLECGKLINLQDWLQAYVSEVDSASEDSSIDPILQSRFANGVSELQHMGYIKSTQRKRDHVQRLTWGAC